ncbi:hypothetical protein CROQUDRAFT_95200 [Cronartium quercuum f. sp. fusiforme G11]|uniref:Uncharacterized protein n=1 Tax=Cronartium quercuum f. sp. fusiforme G11 TaxID=708437 RepID=A0A9P6NHJ2_9BASI|nr:hypothetical protein CROQUDRAFT_95200 [Cronartium quercuum f. sp. fusiforme G11]
MNPEVTSTTMVADVNKDLELPTKTSTAMSVLPEQKVPEERTDFPAHSDVSLKISSPPKETIVSEDDEAVPEKKISNVIEGSQDQPVLTESSAVPTLEGLLKDIIKMIEPERIISIDHAMPVINTSPTGKDLLQKGNIEGETSENLCVQRKKIETHLSVQNSNKVRLEDELKSTIDAIRNSSGTELKFALETLEAKKPTYLSDKIASEIPKKIHLLNNLAALTPQAKNLMSKRELPPFFKEAFFPQEAVQTANLVQVLNDAKSMAVFSHKVLNYSLKFHSGSFPESFNADEKKNFINSVISVMMFQKQGKLPSTSSDEVAMVMVLITILKSSHHNGPTEIQEMNRESQNLVDELHNSLIQAGSLQNIGERAVTYRGAHSLRISFCPFLTVLTVTSIDLLRAYQIRHPLRMTENTLPSIGL